MSGHVSHRQGPSRPVPQRTIRRSHSKSGLTQSLHGDMSRQANSSFSSREPTRKSFEQPGSSFSAGNKESVGGEPHHDRTPPVQSDASRPRNRMSNESRPSLMRHASVSGRRSSPWAQSGGLGTSSESVPRSRTDALLQSKRESMKALYRTGPDDHKIRTGPNHVTGNDRDGGGNTDGAGLDGLAGSRRPRPQRGMPPRSMSGLEAGPLLAMAAAVTPVRAKSHDSIILHDGDATMSSGRSGGEEEFEDEGNSAPHSTHASAKHVPSEQNAKWLERRATKMDEIMAHAHSLKDRFEGEREAREGTSKIDGDEDEDNSKDGDDDQGDEDQPTATQEKKTILQQLAEGVQKTGKGARSLGKGTVNAIQDPKLAAKRLGHLSKDVGMATVKTAMDPKKMAIEAAKGAKKVTVGSAMIGAGLTKGVAKTTFDASKAVVKGSVKATTTSAKMTKKVVKGTVRAVTGKEKSKIVKEDEYDSRHIADRNQSNLYDRISTLVQSNPNNESFSDLDPLEDAILAGIAAKNGQTLTSTTGVAVSSEAATYHRPSSILMPTNLLGASVSGASWDV